MIRRQDQGPGRTPDEADTSPTLPLDAAAAPDPGEEPTVPLEAAGSASGYIGREREHVEMDEHGGVDLARLAWLGTVGACLIAVAILGFEGDYGDAAVTF